MLLPPRARHLLYSFQQREFFSHPFSLSFSYPRTIVEMANSKRASTSKITERRKPDLKALRAQRQTAQYRIELAETNARRTRAGSPKLNNRAQQHYEEFREFRETVLCLE